MIDLKTIEKAQKIINDIKALDSEIIEMQKLASEIAENNCKIGLGIRIDNLSNRNKQNIFTEDGSLKSKYGGLNDDLSHIPFFSPWRIEPKVKETIRIYDFKFSDNQCLILMQFVLKLKYKERDELIIELEKLGVNI